MNSETLVNYISDLLKCDPKTIRRGQKELTELERDTTRTRRPGGGQKKALKPEYSEVDQFFILFNSIP